MKFKPLQNKILVRRKAAEEKTEAGLYIVEKAREKMQVGTILAVGPGLFLPDGSFQQMSLEVGQLVLFGKFAGYDIDVDGEKAIIMDEEDIAATFSEDGKEVFPLSDKLIVRREKLKTVTETGILLPENRNAEDAPQTGLVICGGPGKLLDDGTRQPAQVREGQIVMFGKYAGQTVTLDKQEYLLIEESDVYGVLE